MIEIKKILYATSLSDKSQQVYEYALQMAIKNNAQIILTHAITPMSEMGRYYINQYLPATVTQKVRQEVEQKIVNEIRTRVENFNAEVFSHLALEEIMPIKKVIAHGAHSKVILEVAQRENVDVIVMGTEKNRDDISRSYTTREVLKRAKCPVLVVPVRDK
ncbi:hypothetical protein CEQ07_08210 [Oligella urethralis]|uniref:universal stress protein n=1 Tax=Oligella urethralis TaxID=90245 RepID=UPI000CFE67D3|nr:universal stress protein [Oligella urethralis]AVL71398.1 hypothetical protein CEQ07_08210 [Oligella urethralis]